MPLFIIVQSVMFFDIDAKMEGRFTDVREPEYLLCNDLLYADDTMLTSSDARKLQAVLDAVIDEGRRYGLELNWAKTVAMQIHNDGNIYTPTGDPVQLVDQVVYLGGLLTTQVTAKPEVSRRIGEARGIFKALQRCWAHANICRKRKLELYSAIVLPKLLYNMETLWLLQADRQRIDSFDVQCLRRICRIPHAYFSRVSNASVLGLTRRRPLSETLIQRQISLYMKIANSPADDLLRRLTCESASDSPRVWNTTRRRGRPKQQWAHSIYNLLPRHWI